MHQYLVDDDLEEQRRDQRKHLQEERCNENLAKEPPVFVLAPRNQVMSNRRDRSTSPARRVINTRRPSHTASNSARVIMVGRGESGDWTSALSSLTLPSSRKPPSPSATIAGNGVLTSRSQVVRRDRALSPNSFAQRSISGMPTGLPAKRCRT